MVPAPAQARRTFGRNASREERSDGSYGRRRYAERGAVGPLPHAQDRRSFKVWCYTYASQYPFWGNAMPGAVARASRALAVGNAEQAAFPFKSRGSKQRAGEPVTRLDQRRVTIST